MTRASTGATTVGAMLRLSVGRHRLCRSIVQRQLRQLSIPSSSSSISNDRRHRPLPPPDISIVAARHRWRRRRPDAAPSSSAASSLGVGLPFHSTSSSSSLNDAVVGDDDDDDEEEEHVGDDGVWEGHEDDILSADGKVGGEGRHGRRSLVRRRLGSLESSSSSTPGRPSPVRFEGGGAAADAPPYDLLDLLKTDIFALSWAGPDVAAAESSTNTNANTTTTASCFDSSPSGGGGSLATGDPPIEWRRSSYEITAPTSSSSSTFARSSDHTRRRGMPTAAEIEYDDILDRTDKLMASMLLADGGTTDVVDDTSVSTLQLADFDEVMTRWSRLHALVVADGDDEDDGHGGGDGGRRRKERDGRWGGSSLARNASDQCMRLLRALEDNHDRLLDIGLKSASSSSSSSHDEDNTTTIRHARLMPNAASYNLALHALANSEIGPIAAREAHAILKRMLDRCRQYEDVVHSYEDGGTSSLADMPPLPPPPFEPTVITMNSAINAIARSGAIDAGHLAEDVVLMMERWRDECEGQSSGTCDAEADALDMLDIAPSSCRVESPSPSHPPMQFNNSDGRPSRFYRGIHPNARTLACIIDAWANVKTSRLTSFAPERADAILRMAIKRRRSYVDHVMGRSRGDDAELLQVATINLPDKPEDESAAFVEAGHIAEDIVEGESRAVSMASMSSSQVGETPISKPIERRHPPLRPNTVAFNSCLHAWAAGNRGREGALRAQELLFLLEAYSDSGELDLPDEDQRDVEGDYDVQDTGLTPNVRTYSMVMSAWANVANVERGSGEDAASRCEEILNKMERRSAVDSSVRPNLVAYVTSITAWARTRNVAYAASRAENILNRMIDLYYSENESDLPLLDGDLENASHDAPFNSVITCYARSSDPHATERALAVLERLMASPIRPTVTTFNAVLDVCAKHGDPVTALAVFDKMKTMNIRGDSTSVDTILNAFGRCDKAGSAEQAYDFLRVAEQSEIIYFKPSSVSYSTVINAFARASGRDYGGLPAVKKAEEIYESLIYQMKIGVIDGAADPFANSCLLNCCANVYGSRAEKKEALVIAINAFENMKKRPDLHGEPNQYTFGTMMKVSVRLSSDDAERHRLMEHLFVQACKRGACSKAVLGQFLRYTPPHLNTDVILTLGGTKREIPYSWYRNVSRRQWPTLV
ncbi:hypothetical protein ACHAXA_005990 [Cyclostephanos tholiformis]|uniref:Pentacotripeptide-repeat region of PRORP domain-containing protein n=1 Tax=Cyclostephanos tholiformis TaxID=382380 RepID=A0ABD3SQM2_9STRA